MLQEPGADANTGAALCQGLGNVEREGDLKRTAEYVSKALKGTNAAAVSTCGANPNAGAPNSTASSEDAPNSNDAGASNFVFGSLCCLVGVFLL